MHTEGLGKTILDHRYKGIPLGVEIPLSELGGQGWNVARGDLSLPVTTLRAEALTHNIATFAEYCRRQGARLAPHGKTTMSPQLFQRQLEAGAWAITAATPGQVRIMREFGVPRVLVANEVVEPSALRWIGAQLEADPGFEFLCLVDSVATVELMDTALRGVLSARRMPVLLELGVPGGRTGVRTHEEALVVARAVHASSTLELTGVETYEGLAASAATPEELAAVDALFDRVRAAVTDIAAAGLFASGDVVVTAGGSIHFDRVVGCLSDWSDSPVTPKLVLRSGCYVSHDAGRYHQLSPLDGRRSADEPLELRNALESWAVVLSRPEPGLVIAGAGKRDLPYDVEMPIPLRAHRRNGDSAPEVVDLTGATVTKLMDQHAFLNVDPSLPIAAGDIIVFGLSHPCAAFDKAPLIPLIDDDYTVVDGIVTFF
jgi:D-serine dehydratase